MQYSVSNDQITTQVSRDKCDTRVIVIQSYKGIRLYQMGMEMFPCVSKLSKQNKDVVMLVGSHVNRMKGISGRGNI